MTYTMFKIVWNNPGISKAPVLAVCRTREACEQIIIDRKEIWFCCTGRDITPELEIIEFEIEEN